jgi:hypothetical protein
MTKAESILQVKIVFTYNELYEEPEEGAERAYLDGELIKNDVLDIGHIETLDRSDKANPYD